MKDDRHRVRVAVYILIQRDDKLLFLRRHNTGYMDGKLGLPAGHVEANESIEEAAAREAFEEIGITIQPKDLRLVFMGHRYEPEAVYDYVDFYFDVTKWTDEPMNGEPDKASELVWVPADNLPSDVVPYEIMHLQAWKEGKTLYSAIREEDGV